MRWSNVAQPGRCMAVICPLALIQEVANLIALESLLRYLRDEVVAAFLRQDYQAALARGAGLPVVLEELTGAVYRVEALRRQVFPPALWDCDYEWYILDLAEALT